TYQDASFMSNAETTLFSRGSASLTGQSNPIKTFVDGVELVDPSYLGTIDPTIIERIAIVTGPQAASICGSGAMGGVMQVFTKNGSRRGTPQLKVDLKYGILQSNISDGLTPLHNYAAALRGGSTPELSYDVNLSYQYTGQWQPDLFSQRMNAT